MDKHPKEETTVVLIKPDGVKRGLVGEVLMRIERRGLKLVAMKMVLPSAEQALNHYPNTEEWMRGMGEKTLSDFAHSGKDPVAEMGTADSLELGKEIAKWNVDFLTSGPVVAMAIKGIHSIEMVRKIAGKTIPAQAEMGTVRGDFSVDAPVLANKDKRAIHNVMHASGDHTEAAHEIEHWFTPEEIHDYKRAEEDIMF